MTAAHAGASEWRAHWKIAFGSLVGMGTGWAMYQYVSSLFLGALVAEGVGTRGQISTAFAAGLVGAVFAPLTGRLADRYGVRPVMTLGLVLVGLGYVALANFSHGLAALPFLFAFMATAGTACGVIVYTRAVNSWFDRNRGLALGVAIAGTSVFALFVPLALGWAIGAHGAAGGYYVMSAVALLVGLPIVLATVWERREWEARGRGGLRAVAAARAAAGAAPRSATPPDGARPEDVAIGAARADGVHAGDAAAAGTEAVDHATSHLHGRSWPETLRMRQYWLLVGAMIFVNLAGAGFLSQLTPLMTDRGLSVGDAAVLTGAFAFATLSGRLLSGFLVDRIAPLGVAFAVTAIPAAGCALLLGGEATFAVALAAVILLGLQQGAEMDLLAFFVARYFGMRNYASIFGSLITVLAISTAIGIAGFGRSFDATGSYDLALTASIGAFLLGALCFGSLGRVPPTEGAPRAAAAAA